MQRIHKQTSLESPGLSYRDSQPANGEGVDSPASRPLNRSLTISGPRRSSGAPALARSRDPTSPLKRFTHAKQSISRAFGFIRDRLVESQSFMQLSRQSSDCPSLDGLLSRTRGIEEILSRDHMKVAFFGRTSNGKSTVINALLRDKVLPAGIGHTTNCFCSVIGSDSDEGYLLTPGSHEKQNVKVCWQTLLLALVSKIPVPTHNITVIYTVQWNLR